LQQGFSL